MARQSNGAIALEAFKKAKGEKGGGNYLTQEDKDALVASQEPFTLVEFKLIKEGGFVRRRLKEGEKAPDKWDVHILDKNGNAKIISFGSITNRDEAFRGFQAIIKKYGPIPGIILVIGKKKGGRNPAYFLQAADSVSEEKAKPKRGKKK